MGFLAHKNDQNVVLVDNNVVLYTTNISTSNCSFKNLTDYKTYAVRIVKVGLMTSTSYQMFHPVSLFKGNSLHIECMTLESLIKNLAYNVVGSLASPRTRGQNGYFNICEFNKSH